VLLYRLTTAKAKCAYMRDPRVTPRLGRAHKLGSNSKGVH